MMKTKEEFLAERIDVGLLPNGIKDKIYQAMELFSAQNEEVAANRSRTLCALKIKLDNEINTQINILLTDFERQTGLRPILCATAELLPSGEFNTKYHTEVSGVSELK